LGEKENHAQKSKRRKTLTNLEEVKEGSWREDEELVHIRPLREGNQRRFHFP